MRSKTTSFPDPFPLLVRSWANMMSFLFVFVWFIDTQTQAAAVWFREVSGFGSSLWFDVLQPLRGHHVAADGACTVCGDCGSVSWLHRALATVIARQLRGRFITVCRGAASVWATCVCFEVSSH